MSDEARSLAIVGGDRIDTGTPDRLTIIDGHIVNGSANGSVNGSLDATVAGQGPSIDVDGLRVCPGLVDLQVNGGYGLDLAADPASMWELGRRLPRHGVTSFLPTIISSPAATTDRALAAFGRPPCDHRGAVPLGLHFEGPMLNPERAGAHAIENLVAPDPEIAARWTKANGVALVTLAPELPGAVDLIARLTAEGVVVSAGHSVATSTETSACFAAGVSMVTHLFNAMGPMGHRDPGLAGSALADDGVAVGIIADGVHVDPLMVKVAWRAKGPDRVVLVTDAVAAMGLGPGHYEFGGSVVTADDTGVRNETGILAGSALTMDRAVANVIEFTGCSSAEAVTAASSTPAAVIGATDRGHLLPGAVADVVLLEPDGTVAMTICRGEIAYVADGAAERIAGWEGVEPWRS